MSRSYRYGGPDGQIFCSAPLPVSLCQLFCISDRDTMLGKLMYEVSE